MYHKILASKAKPMAFGSLGQSLLEMVVLIGLATVIVTGLTIVTINGLKNSQFSQNQAQATRLAQDAIDKIRTMRDQNCPVSIAGTDYYWYDQANPTDLIWNKDPAGSNFKFISPVNCGPSQPLGTGLKNPADTGGLDLSIPLPLQTTFQRSIKMENFSPTQKKILVNVTWVDISGTHQSNLSTIMGEN